MVKKDKRPTFYILTRTGNGGSKRSLLRRRALRVANHFPSSGEDCVMKSWRKLLASLTQCLYTRQVLSEVGDHVGFLEVSPGLTIFQQVHNQRQAWKSSHDLHYKPKVVVNCTFPAFNVVQINKVNGRFSESSPDGCLLIPVYSDIAGQFTFARVRVCICVSGVVRTPRLVGRKWVSTRYRSDPQVAKRAPGRERFRVVETMPPYLQNTFTIERLQRLLGRSQRSSSSTLHSRLASSSLTC